MLSVQDNELMCRVGPGTPMGDLMRQYWIPALHVERAAGARLPAAAPAPAGREPHRLPRRRPARSASSQNACPHRGASLFFGRNEEEGLRCVYHGWKFDVTGACVDMPSEPAESNFKNKVRTGAYPCIERSGVVWTYMGPRDDAAAAAATSRPTCCRRRVPIVSKILRECNWMQALEGDIDTSHLGFLHLRRRRRRRTPMPGTLRLLRACATARPSTTCIDTEFGTSYGAYRPAEDDTYYWRIAHFLFPFYTMIPTGVLGVQVARARLGAARRRAHDVLEHGGTGYAHRRRRAQPATRTTRRSGASRRRGVDRRQRAGGFEYLPRHDGLARQVPPRPRTRSNDYLIDREAQAHGASYTGIPRHLPAGPGRHREHGHDLRAHQRAPRHVRRHDHPHAPPPDQRREGPARRAARCRPASTTRRSTARAPAASSCRARRIGSTRRRMLDGPRWRLGRRSRLGFSPKPPLADALRQAQGDLRSDVIFPRA